MATSDNNHLQWLEGWGGGGSLAGVHAPHQLLPGLWVSPQHAGVEKQHAHSLALAHVGWKVYPPTPTAGVHVQACAGGAMLVFITFTRE